MPPGDVDVKAEQGQRQPLPAESAFGPLALAQGYLGLDAFRRAGSDPRIRAKVVDSAIAQRQRELNPLTDELRKVELHLRRDGGAWIGGHAVAEQKRDLLRQQISSVQESITNMQAEKEILPQQVAEAGRTQELSGKALDRLLSIIEGKDLGVSPEERQLIAESMSGVSQDVATSRGLNRTDVPVMQAIAPEISRAILAQANANRSLFTGINQFQQGMGLSNRQLQMGLAGQNPAANLSGVYAGLAPQNQGQSQSRGLGGPDIFGMAGQGAMGLGLGAYGLGASGLLGGGGIGLTGLTAGGVTGTTGLGGLMINTSPGVAAAYGGGAIGASDRRLKRNVRPLTKALEAIRRLSGYAFQWRATEQPGHGVMAQEVEQVLPEAVTERDGAKQVDYAAIIAVLVEAVKELDAKVQAHHG